MKLAELIARKSAEYFSRYKRPAPPPCQAWCQSERERVFTALDAYPFLHGVRAIAEATEVSKSAVDRLLKSEVAAGNLVVVERDGRGRAELYRRASVPAVPGQERVCPGTEPPDPGQEGGRGVAVSSPVVRRSLGGEGGEQRTTNDGMRAALGEARAGQAGTDRDRTEKLLDALARALRVATPESLTEVLCALASAATNGSTTAGTAAPLSSSGSPVLPSAARAAASPSESSAGSSRPAVSAPSLVSEPQTRPPESPRTEPVAKPPLVLELTRAALATGAPPRPHAEELLRRKGEDLGRALGHVWLLALRDRLIDTPCAALQWWLAHLDKLPRGAPATLEVAIARGRELGVAVPEWAREVDLGPVAPAAEAPKALPARRRQVVIPPSEEERRASVARLSNYAGAAAAP